MTIPFTGYRNGSSYPTCIQRSPEVESMAKVVTAAGGTFNAELLSTGAISLQAYIGEHVLAHELSPNDSHIREAVDRLVERAAEKLNHSTPPTAASVTP